MGCVEGVVVMLRLWCCGCGVGAACRFGKSSEFGKGLEVVCALDVQSSRTSLSYCSGSETSRIDYTTSPCPGGNCDGNLHCWIELG